MTNLQFCNQQTAAFKKVLQKPKTPRGDPFTAVDLGTANVVLVVLDQDGQLVAGALKEAEVVRDGMVVDYIGAVDIVRQLKAQVEEELGQELVYAASARPPGTESVDAGVIRNVLEATGLYIEEGNIIDEPTAANELVHLENGAVVDIGGGTTGVTIFQDGKVVKNWDEATGGKHFSLVIAGANNISFEEAEKWKKDEEKQKDLLPLLYPVIDKVSSIIVQDLESYALEEVILVGGMASLPGIEDRVAKNLGIKVIKPKDPLFVTPLGIAHYGLRKEEA